MRFLLVLLALFAAMAFADKHVDTGIIKVADQVDLTSEHFFVSVDYVEDELDDTGKLLAERDIKIALRFDVDEKKQVLVNGVPAEVGYSELQVAAKIVEVQGPGQHVVFPKLFSVSLRLFVALEVREDGVTHVLIQERVVGIEASETFQADVLQQVIIVRKDGTIERGETVKVAFVRGEPEVKEEVKEEVQGEVKEEGEKPKGHGHGHGKEGKEGEEVKEEGEKPKGHGKGHGKGHNKTKCFFRKVAKWFHNLPLYLRVLVSFAGGVTLGLIGIGIIRLFSCICSKKKCQRKAVPADNYKENIRVYSLQYTAAPQDEKDAKKEGAPAGNGNGVNDLV